MSEVAVAAGEGHLLADVVAASLFAARMGAVLLAVFGFLALVLAAIGLYGVMSYAVSRRTREIGIRMALGAGKGNVLRLVLKEGLALVGTGVAAGLIVAVAATRLLTSFLFGVSPLDATTFAAIPLVLALVVGACAPGASVAPTTSTAAWSACSRGSPRRASSI